MISALLVALAGGLGAAARFQSDALIARAGRWRLPIATLVINTLGMYDSYAGMILPLLVDAAGVFIILQGVRLILAEIVPRARIGIISGPNLAREVAQRQPAALPRPRRPAGRRHRCRPADRRGRRRRLL